jgi:hypothetical protein
MDLYSRILRLFIAVVITKIDVDGLLMTIIESRVNQGNYWRVSVEEC